MGECWRSVVGFEGRYRVSDRERIQNVVTGRFLNGSPNKGGYICVGLTTERGKGRMFYLHRKVCAAFHGLPPSPTLVVNHLSGSKFDCRLQNLCWCSRPENNAHAAKLGLLKGRLSGSKNPGAKLTEEVVIEMRRRSARGDSYTRLAEMYGVTPATAYRAVVGITWRHVSEDALSSQAGRRAADFTRHSGNKRHLSEVSGKPSSAGGSSFVGRSGW